MALNPLVSVIGRLVACSGRKRGNRQTDGMTKTTTVTLAAHARPGLTSLAAHARRGLIIQNVNIPWFIETS